MLSEYTECNTKNHKGPELLKERHEKPKKCMTGFDHLLYVQHINQDAEVKNASQSFYKISLGNAVIFYLFKYKKVHLIEKTQLKEEFLVCKNLVV